MSVPDSVRTAVLARMQQMQRPERRLLMCASVIGRQFDISLVSAAARCTEARARAALERARELQLVEADESARYSFRHALTRDVVYAELVQGRTRPLHRRIARALERGAASAGAAIDDLAYHAWAAGDARRGLRYNELAGDRAAAVHADDDAQVYFTRARGLVAVRSRAYARLSKKLRALAGGSQSAQRW